MRKISSYFSTIQKKKFLLEKKIDPVILGGGHWPVEGWKRTVTATRKGED